MQINGLGSCQCAACQFVLKATIFQADYEKFETASVVEGDEYVGDVTFFTIMDLRATVQIDPHTHQWH